MFDDKKPNLVIQNHHYRTEADDSMFKKSSMDFNCSYTIRHKQKIIFGWTCVTSMEPFYENLLSKPDFDKSRENLPTCESLCLSISGHQPSYDEFMNIKLTSLKAFCPEQQCAFNVVVEFDFDNLTWVRDNGAVISDLVWINDAFPIIDDLVVLFLGRRHDEDAIYRTFNGPRKNFWKYRDHLEAELSVQPYVINTINSTINPVKGFFFCVEDSLSKSNLKFGTFSQAKDYCSKIMTPKICHNKTLVEKLTNLTQKSSEFIHHFNTRPRKVLPN